MTTEPVVKCPACDRGTTTDSNGRRWRCHLCNGTGRVYASTRDKWEERHVSQ